MQTSVKWSQEPAECHIQTTSPTPDPATLPFQPTNHHPRQRWRSAECERGSTNHRNSILALTDYFADLPILNLRPVQVKIKF
jgi:hypothetical protein